MPLYGSSPFNVTGYTFTAVSGNRGEQGITGPQGFKGNLGLGPTGPSGYGITAFNYSNDIITTIYTNGSLAGSNTINKLHGNYVLELTGVTAGRFSPLDSTELLHDFTATYDLDGHSNTFKTVRRLNFKNIKTNSSPFIDIKYTGAPPDGIEPSETIKITYDVFNRGGSNISGGPDGSLVINNPGNIQSGFTGTTYNTDEKSVQFAMMNFGEQLVVVNPLKLQNDTVRVWRIDPAEGSLFYLQGYGGGIVNTVDTGVVFGNHIMIKNTKDRIGSTNILKSLFTDGTNFGTFSETWGNFSTSGLPLGGGGVLNSNNPGGTVDYINGTAILKTRAFNGSPDPRGGTNISTKNSRAELRDTLSWTGSGLSISTISTNNNNKLTVTANAKIIQGLDVHLSLVGFYRTHVDQNDALIAFGNTGGSTWRCLVTDLLPSNVPISKLDLNTSINRSENHLLSVEISEDGRHAIFKCDNNLIYDYYDASGVVVGTPVYAGAAIRDRSPIGSNGSSTEGQLAIDFMKFNQYKSTNQQEIESQVNTTADTSKAFTVIFHSDIPEIPASNTKNRLFYSTYSYDNDITDANFLTETFKATFKPNIIWQSNSYFCPGNKTLGNQVDMVNFISLGSRYFAIPIARSLDVSQVNLPQTIPDFGCKPSNLQNFFRIISVQKEGLCCNDDCTCTFGYDTDCTGYFMEGVTCGGDTGPCTSLGACSMYSSTKNRVIPCQELSYCQCKQTAIASGLEYNWNPFSGIKKSCGDFNSSNAMNSIGACCDGNGSCNEISETDCSASGGYFQGAGVNCSTSENLNVCIDGNGACCNSGIVCSSGVTGSDCIQANMSYFGDDTTCNDFTCNASNIPCFTSIADTTLAPGMEFDGGIVVGIFNPNKSMCFGPKLFDGTETGFNNLTGITQQSCIEYYSAYDYSGYGFDPNEICDKDGDSYLVIVSPHPINIDSSKTLIDGSTDIHEFDWSNGSVAWGPLVDIGLGAIDEFTINNLSYKEGYVYDASVEKSSQMSLYGNSFLTCSSARIDTNSISYLENRPTQSFIGNWTRNNGLYNTIRLVGSEFFYYNIKNSSDGALISNYTPLNSNITAARALSIYNRAKPSSYTNSSKWFIPSIDELSYIANHCRQSSPWNLNSRLLELGYSPINGWHWSSTGAFDITNGEGILDLPDIPHGSQAWALNFDVDGISENMMASRKSRDSQLNIRPIKLIRCDKRYYSSTDSNFRIWQVPILSESIIDNQ